MRVLYLGKFRPAYATENYVTYALRQHGVEVKCLGVHQTSFKKVKWHAQKFRPNLILFAKSQQGWFSNLLDWCSKKHLLTVTWFWDLLWGYRSQGGKRIPQQFRANLVLSTDGGHESAWREHGINHLVLRQGIHKPEHQFFEAEKYKHDVAFVGSVWGRSRQLLVDWLRRTYGKRMIHHTTCRGLDLNRALSEVKIVVGDSHNVGHYWSNRIYEIIGRGGFLLHPSTVGLEDEFTAGKHYINYERNNFVWLQHLIERWLQDDAGRERIRREGFEYCGIHYTYESRVAELLQRIREVPSL